MLKIDSGFLGQWHSIFARATFPELFEVRQITRDETRRVGDDSVWEAGTDEVARGIPPLDPGLSAFE